MKIDLPTYPARPVSGGPLEKEQKSYGDWAYEPKYNGWRTVVHGPSGTMWNRHGKALSIQSDFQDALKRLKELSAKTGIDFWDCEGLERRHNMMRGTLIVLDYLPLHEVGATYLERKEWLIHELDCVSAKLVVSGKGIVITCAFADQKNSLSFWDELKEQNKKLGTDFYEGVVKKRMDSVYPLQLLNPSQEFPFWIKHRFL